MINEASLSDKWWYRTLKVSYVLVWILSILIVALIAYSVRPQKTQSYSEINVDCNNKKENNFYFSPSDSFFTSIDDINWTNADEELATKSCEYGLHKGDYSQFPSVARNYTVRLKFDASGSWKSVLITLGVGFLIVFGVIEIIKTIVLYILGFSIWRGMLLYSLLFIASMASNDKKT